MQYTIEKVVKDPFGRRAWEKLTLPIFQSGISKQTVPTVKHKEKGINEYPQLLQKNDN